MSIIGTIYEDVTTDILGKIGSWQWLVTFVSTALMMPAMFNQYVDIFLLEPAQVTCIPPRHAKVVNATLCFATIKNNHTEIFECNTWHVKFMGLIWIKKSWLVFCDQKLKLLSTAIISRFGLVFGCIIFGLISDSFGRKTAIKINVLAELVLGLATTFCDSEAWFRLLIFLKSLFGSANFYMGLVIVCEIASNSWRSWLCLIVMSPRLLATVCLVPLANCAYNPETYSFIACMFCIVYISLLRWSPESPQWLLYNRKIALAEKTLLEAAKRNGIKLCSDFKIRPVNHRAYHCLDEATSCVGILITYNIRITFLVIITFWMLYYFLWSSLYVRLYSYKDINQHLLKVFCFVILLGSLTIILSAKFVMRRLLFLHIVMTGICTVLVIYFGEDLTQNTLSSFAIASGVIIHAIILNITPRLLAINVRATGFGCCHAAGQLGSMISYLLYFFRPICDSIFIVVLVLVALSLAGLCLMMLDVDGRELPDIMEDMDYFSELSKPFRWAAQKSSSPSREEIEMRVYSFGSSGRNMMHSQSHSDERVPAQPIGCVKLWRRFMGFLRR